jgi:hypothetical protein
MAIRETDQRTPERRARDEQIATESRLPPPNLSSDAIPLLVEAHFGKLRRQPVAITGVVENGLIRPLDSSVKLPENSRVIIVAEAS